MRTLYVVSGAQNVVKLDQTMVENVVSVIRLTGYNKIQAIKLFKGLQYVEDGGKNPLDLLAAKEIVEQVASAKGIDFCKG